MIIICMAIPDAYFADTVFWLALISPKDENHAAARSLQASIHNRKIVTSQLVLVEFLNSFRSGKLQAEETRQVKENMCKLIQALLASDFLEVVEQDNDLFEQTFELYGQRLDKDWSFVDCASFVIMRQKGLRSALTTDKHFQQAGFATLMRH